MQILATKLHLPTLRANIVTRPRLFDLLNAGLLEQRKLTLISAPAGYGKTMMVSEWLQMLTRRSDNGESKVKTAWLSLDQTDNDLARFARYWLAAFQQAVPSLGHEAQLLLNHPQLPPVQIMLDQLLNDLSSLDVQVLMALDDYHLIHNPEIHEAVEYFLDHQPAWVHLIIITRADPPLPVARLRARGQLTEIRANTLRFTPEEAHQFFDSSLGSFLDANLLRSLEERTEGWVAGLHLAALALQHQADPAAFVETFRGSHRYVLDYLAEEVIRQQEEAVRDFLTKTSVLNRFTAESCCALTGREDSQALIQYLEQSNLFIIPLDDERRWYRYHHLFSDYLRSLLSKSEETALCQKASTWHEASGLVEEAVHYALASGDPNFSAGAIERALKKGDTWSGGNVTLLSSWLESLPQEVFGDRPELSLHASRILYLVGRLEQSEARIDQAERALDSEPKTPGVEQMYALVMLYRGAIASARGDFERAIEQTTLAQARLPAENHLAHARAFYSLGLAYDVAAQTGLAVENYMRSSQEARAAGVLFLVVNALGAAAQLQMKQAHFSQAVQTCQSALEVARDARIAPLGLIRTILGVVALERNDLQAASRFLEDGIALSRQGGLVEDVAFGLVSLARLHAYQNDIHGALKAMTEAQALMRAYGIPRMELLFSAYLARLHLFLGQKQEALQWVAKYQPVRTQSAREFEELTLARIFLATGDLDPVPGILQPVLEMASSAGRAQACIEVMLLLGMYHYARHDLPAAVDWLSNALNLAAPEGYVRIFLDEGGPVLDLLAKARHAAPEFVESLLRFYEPAGRHKPTPSELLPEPLSEQEIRVLSLIAAGKSNQEIAAELVITVGTAKWHVHNVLQKLGVNNRSRAIVHARELGLVP